MAGEEQKKDPQVAIEVKKDDHDAGDVNAHDEEGHGEPKKDFVPSHGITTEEADELMKQWGRNELEEKSTPSWLIFLQQLYAPMPIMIWIAAIIEAAIQNWIDFGILMGIQFLNAFLGWYETTKAGDAVKALKASLKPLATVKRDGKWQTLDAALLVPGDCVLLASGSAVPADCLVNHGQIEVDQAALTGESLPVTLYQGDSAKMGSTVVRGEVEGTVEFTGKYTFFGKTATLLQAGNEIGHLQKILLTIMFVLVAISFLLCGTCFGYLMGMGESFVDALEFTVVLLVASIPIAIEIVCTTTLALGSRQLSAHGAIVTRLAAIEDMAGMNMLCSDKTGTLTLNKMVIQDDTPTFVPDMDQAELLRMAGLAAKWKEPPRDALDTLVLTSVDLASLEAYEQLDFMPFDPTQKRTEGTVKHKETGKSFKTSKGAPHIILKLVEDPQVHHAVETKVTGFGTRGIRCLAVARTTNEDMNKWEMCGLLTFLDPPRPDTKHTIERAMEYGVDVKMITGDHTLIAKETARTLGMGDNIKDPKGLPSMDADGKCPKDLGEKYGKMVMEADGFAQVFPEHKYLIVETLRQAGFAVGMTGDGVNDAPALKRADVGVAVQGATDAARAAADIVLTQPGLSTIVEGIIIARQIFQRMKNFINYRIAATLQLLVFFFIAVLALHPVDYEPSQYYYCGPDGDPATGGNDQCEDPNNAEWPAFFKMPVLMLMLITLLNDGTLISIGYDHVKPSPRPEKWNLKALFSISCILGAVACGSSLLLLWASLDSWNPDGIFQKWGLGPMPYGHVTTMVYLKVSVSDFLTLFSARTHEGFFWSATPSWILLTAALFALSLSTLLACIWPLGNPDDINAWGLAYGEYTLMPLWIWIYCIVWWFIQDTLKVVGYYILHRFNIFNINGSSAINIRDVTKLDDKAHPLARASVGLVEKKLLDRKVEEAIEKVDKVNKKSLPGSNLQRTSQAMAQNLAAMKKQGEITRTSITEGKQENLAEHAKKIESQVQQLEGHAAQLPDELDKKEIQTTLDQVKEAAAKMKEATAIAAGKPPEKYTEGTYTGRIV